MTTTRALIPLLSAMGVHPLRSNARRRRIVVARQDVLEAFADLEFTAPLPTGKELEAEEIERRLVAAGITREQVSRAVVSLYTR
jgi:hypothetical protein